MFSSQRLSLVFGLSLIVLSVASANKANAQALVVDSLDSPSQESGSSPVGTQVQESVADLREISQVLSSSTFLRAGNNFYVTAISKRGVDSFEVQGLMPEPAQIEGNTFASALNGSNAVTVEPVQFIESANQLSSNLPIDELPLEVGILPNSSSSQPFGGIEGTSPSILVSYPSLNEMVSTPEPSITLLPWLGLAALGFLPIRFKSSRKNSSS